MIARFRRRYVLWALALELVVLLFAQRAAAIPSYSRKYGTSCQTCHTVYPALNTFGEAFRRNGHRFPSQDGSLDSDAVKAPSLPLGQEESEKSFPNSIWSSHIAETIPLSAMIDGNVAYRFPGSAAEKSAGRTFGWNGILNSLRIYAGGSFSDKMTYYAKIVFKDSGTDIQAGEIMWNDLVGPRHAINVWIGRLSGPQLTSFGPRSVLFTQTMLPQTSVTGLFNPNSTFVLGTGHTDGVEVNGIIAHRIGYSAGWIASTAQSGLNVPTSEDAYVHVGGKIGGMSLDGEGRSGMQVANMLKPWAETSATLDLWAYHGVTVTDNGTLYPDYAPQRSGFNVVGASIRGNLESLQIDLGGQIQRHFWPYAGTGPQPAQPPAIPNTLPGMTDPARAYAYLAYTEITYVVFPWLVPGLRAEYTRLESPYGMGNFSRFIPGAAILLRPNVKLVVSADLQRVHKLPPQRDGVASSWAAAGTTLVPDPGSSSKFEAQQVSAYVAWAL
jgi:hypothetical protein